MPTGRVKWFNGDKGYGFIAMDDPPSPHEPDIFVHHTGIAGLDYKLLEEGQAVEFDIEATGANGWQPERFPFMVRLPEVSQHRRGCWRK
jgi:CspA family cold shock protein